MLLVFNQIIALHCILRYLALCIICHALVYCQNVLNLPLHQHWLWIIGVIGISWIALQCMCSVERVVMRQLFQKPLLGCFFLLPFYVQKWHKKIEKSRSTFSWLETGLKFWPHLQGKTGPKQPKKCDFPKLAQNPPKNRNAWTRCLPNHFGGCFARFLDSVLRSGRTKCNFLALENGHFCQK